MRCFAAAAATILPTIPLPVYMTILAIHNESLDNPVYHCTHCDPTEAPIAILG